jgi:hypothetical protein
MKCATVVLVLLTVNCFHSATDTQVFSEHTKCQRIAQATHTSSCNTLQPTLCCQVPPQPHILCHLGQEHQLRYPNNLLS